MTEVRFYQLQRSSLEEVLPQLLEKTFERGQRAVVMTGSEERAEALTAHLWTYKDRRFLPHGNARDGHAARQPIWLTPEDENPNDAQVLFLTDGAVSDHVGDFALCIELFDGNDTDIVAAARRRWTTYKKAGHDLTYYQQTEGGRWEEKKGG
ncbi:DNA polymerase III subunit chi [Rhodospirillaceae bacterium SYSU D60014]|uniref:DNA polymerase III subunit chi n=1 Tax=Virgifigura deserti TaxID=2268457 RepID=UPI000E67181E